MLTVDTLTLGWRPRDLRNGYLPFLKGEGLGQFFSDEAFLARLESPPEENLVTASLMALSAFPNLALTWDDLARLREWTSLPILLKGVVRGDDARRALEYGIDGIVVSNHGGRQVDGSVAALDALVEVREAVGPRRGRADGLRDPHRRGRRQGGRARRERGAARPRVRLRPRRSAARRASRP